MPCEREGLFLVKGRAGLLALCLTWALTLNAPASREQEPAPMVVAAAEPVLWHEVRTQPTRSVRVTRSVRRAPDPAQQWVSRRDVRKIRRCESTDDYSAVSPSGTYRGAWQFDRPTWRSVGGVGDPAKASRREQDLRAYLLYKRRGFQPWECAKILGLRGNPR